MAGCARLSERGKSDESGGESVERTRQAIEQLAADMADERRIGAINCAVERSFGRFIVLTA